MATHAARAANGSGTGSAAAGSALQASTERLGRAFFGLAGLTYGLIVLGALVRAHGAGLSCPDWPLCFGEVIPQLDFKVAFEFGHRVVAGGVAILFTGLSVATLRRPELAAALRRPLAIAALLLGVQIVLGGLTVLELLATWTVTSHLLTGNAFALALVLIGRRIVALARRSPAAAVHAAPAAPASGLARLATSAVAALLVAQVALGGLVSSSYAGLVCPDWPACMHGEFFPTFSGIQGLHVLHRTLAYTLIVALPLAALLARPDRALARLLGLASVLVVGQATVGVANVLLRLPVEITALHSALAAALVCTLGVAVDTAWSRRTA